MVRASDLQVNQSTLTGESNPVRKTSDAVLEEDLTQAETPNLIFAGTSVSEGTGRARGHAHRHGDGVWQDRPPHAEHAGGREPLQLQLNRTTKQITIFATCMGVGFFLLDALFVKSEFAVAFIFSLGMIVAFIPEGLLPTVTLSLAMAVQRMSKRNALVKKLNSVGDPGLVLGHLHGQDGHAHAERDDGEPPPGPRATSTRSPAWLRARGLRPPGRRTWTPMPTTTCGCS